MLTVQVQIESIMESDSGMLNEAKAAAVIPGGMTKSEALETVGSLLADHWLCEPKRLTAPLPS